jgi:RHS repeat-associated protein
VTIGGRVADVTAGNRFIGRAAVSGGTSQIEIRAIDPNGNIRTNTYEISQSGSSVSSTFDANGNLTSDGIRTFEWDAQDRLIGVVEGTERAEFFYDARNQRSSIVRKSSGVVIHEEKLIWCDGALCEQRAANGTAVVRRLFGQGEQIGSAEIFYSADHLGSPVEVTDDTGASVASYAFDPWGRRTLADGSDVTDIGYTRHRWEPRAQEWSAMRRQYDPARARWSSEDPAGLVDGPNRYAYVTNNPLMRVDPFGLCKCDAPCKSGSWQMDGASIEGGSFGVTFSAGKSRIRCAGAPGVARWATVYCATFGIYASAGANVQVQYAGAAVTGPCKPEDLKEFRTSGWIASSPVGSVGGSGFNLESFGFGLSVGGGVAIVKCRVVPS